MRGLATGSDIAIIGNCPDFNDTSRVTDAFRQVTRFNNAAGFGRVSGTKTSELVLVSRGGQATEWTADPDFVDRPVVRQAEFVTLVFPPSVNPDDECSAEALTTLLQGIGKRVRYIDQRVHDLARQNLTTLGAPRDAALSSGFVYAFETLLTRRPEAPPVSLFGFSFEGWSGHAWNAERRWFENMQKQGRVIIHVP